MPLFRRKPDAQADVVDDSPAPAGSPPPAGSAAPAGSAVPAGSAAPKGYTPPKGRVTPRRGPTQVRRSSEPPPANRREALKRRREFDRAARAEAAEGMKRGEEKYLLPRDRGPERALVRDIVDSRRTIGTWFFVGAFIVIIGSSAAMPESVRLASNLVWVALALAVIFDSIMITRRIGRLVRARFPNTTQKTRSLYIYGIMRSIMFRRMRIPKPRVKFGESI